MQTNNKLPLSKSKIKAVALDTNIFFEYNFDFSAEMLQRLKILSEYHICLLIPDIIYAEVINNLVIRIEEMASSFRQTANKCKRAGFNCESSLFSVLDDIVDIDSYESTAIDKLQNFLKAVNMQIIPTKNIDLEKLISLYSSRNAPFENSDKKKHEFPDAIALLALEKWAKKNKGKVLFITKDKGCLEYSKQSSSIIVEDKVSYVIEMCLPKDLVNIYLPKLKNLFYIESNNPFYDEPSGLIKSVINNANPKVIVASMHNPEVENVSLEYLSHYLIADMEGEGIKINILEITKNQIQFEINTIVKFNVHYDLLYSEFDNKGNLIGFYTESDTGIKHQEFAVTITLCGNLSKAITANNIKSIRMLNNIKDIVVYDNDYIAALSARQGTL